MNQAQINQDAMALFDDYQKNGIDHINEVAHRGPSPLNIEVISLVARWLQSDEVFSNWAFIEIMTASNKQEI